MGLNHSFRTNFSSPLHYPAYVIHSTDFIKTISRQTKAHRAPMLAGKKYTRGGWNTLIIGISPLKGWRCYYMWLFSSSPSSLLVGPTYDMKPFSKVPHLQTEGSADSANGDLEEHQCQELASGPHWAIKAEAWLNRCFSGRLTHDNG